MTLFGYRPDLDPQAGYEMQISNNQVAISNQITITQIPSSNTVVPTKKPVSAYVDTTSDKWGVAKQIGEHTWTMKVGQDPVMSTPKEMMEALNEYRVRRGAQRLAWDENLAGFAQSRADYLNTRGSTDEHKGFADFLENQNGYEKLGFTWLGENISYGYKLNGVHMIEWIYAGDKPHDDNQINNRWNYVGIGVKGTATAVIFGTGKR